MKKFLLVAAILCAASFASKAQDGSMYIGGGVFVDEDDWKVAPEAGIWLSDELQLGLVATFANDNLGGIAPHVYLRKWWSVGEKFGLYLGANARYVNVNSNSNIDVFIDAGFAYTVAPRWGIVGRAASVGYINETATFDFNMSPQSMFNVGIYYTFKE